MNIGTSELVETLKTQDLTEAEAYNLIIADLYEFISMEEVAAAQRLIRYFEYKVKSVCFTAITDLRKPARV